MTFWKNDTRVSSADKIISMHDERVDFFLLTRLYFLTSDKCVLQCALLSMPMSMYFDRY